MAGPQAPTRMCVACRTRRVKADLVRIVRQPGGRVTLDPDAVLEGRGAYLCADGDCWRTARKRASLERALRTSLPLELQRRLEHGDVAFHAATDPGAPVTIGGTDGT